MTDAPEKIWAKEGHDSWGQYGGWYRDNKGGGIAYTRTDLADARIVEIQGSLHRAEMNCQYLAQEIEAKDARIKELERELGHCIYELDRDGSRKPHRVRRAALARAALETKEKP